MIQKQAEKQIKKIGTRIVFLFFILVMPLSANSQDDVLYRINAGGPAVTTGGLYWSADQYFSGQTATYGTSSSIGGTTDDVLYQSERFGKTFSYNIPVESGTYKAILHFAEIYNTAENTRVFSVSIEGQTVLSGYDIYEDVGSNYAAIKTFSGIAVSDGALTIGFTTSADNAKLSSLEVVAESVDPIAELSVSPSALDFGDQQVDTVTTQTLTLGNSGNIDLYVTGIDISGAGAFTYGGSTGFIVSPGASVPVEVDFQPVIEGFQSGMMTITHNGDNPAVTVDLSGTAVLVPSGGDVLYRINAGGPAVTTGGLYWSADQYFSGQTATYGTSSSIGGTTDDVLYQSERFGKTFSYNIPVESGTYKAILHFAEIYNTDRKSVV